MIRLTRRTVLGTGAAALPALALPAVLRAQSPAAQVSLILDGIGPGLDPDLLDLIAAPFLDAGLALTSVADLAALTQPEAKGQALCDRLARMALRDPGLFDLALPIGKLPRTERYFQLRRAGELRDAVVRAFGKGPAAAQSFPVVTLIDRGEDPNIDHTAFRGAGFRVHLAAGDGPVRLGVAGRGELVGSGGIWAGLAAPDLAGRIEAALRGGGDLLLALSVDGATTANAAALVASAKAIAERLAQAVQGGRANLINPPQLRLYAAGGLPLDVALLAEAGTNPAEDAALLAFVRDLADHGVPLTVAGRAKDFADLPDAVTFCPPAPTDIGDALPPAECLRDGPAPSPDSLTFPVAVHVAARPAVWTRQGIGPDGRLALTLRQLSATDAEGVLGLSPLEDHVISVRGEDVMQPMRRAQLLRQLVEAALSGRVYFHSIPGLADHLVATEPVLARLWSVRRRSLTDPRRDPSADAGEQARLMEDARLAWRYIDRFTDDRSGLCAGTVQLGAKTVINHEATMWDLASQLHAIRVASQLALIDPAEARQRARHMIRNLPLALVDGHPLPPAMFRTDSAAASTKVVTHGFDICDVGRFLIALRAAVDSALIDDSDAKAVLVAWDLAVALPDGRPHSNLAGQWVDTTLSHCTPYIRRGMAGWGYDLVSPYAGLTRGSPTDRQIALLYDVARIGHVGVEPVLLESIEIGPDPASDLISDILFDAQLDWLETTGQLKCASEAPLNFPPWFSYQGLRFGHLGKAAWVVRGIGGAADHETEAFQTRAEVLSAKSAYLWAAVRSHPYCDQLLQIMRDKARIEGMGFSVGVFTATMQAMPGYSDLNTNGVILTAIGHALR